VNTLARTLDPVQAAVDQIAGARAAITFDEPADINRLFQQRGTRGQRATSTFYAMMKLAQLTVILGHLRGLALQGGLDLPTLKAIAAEQMAFYGKTYRGFYQMTDTAAIVQTGLAALPSVETVADFAALAGAVSNYVGRIEYWVDARVPWPQLGAAFEAAVEP
jgi:hypothetical protein